MPTLNSLACTTLVLTMIELLIISLIDEFRVTKSIVHQGLGWYRRRSIIAGMAGPSLHHYIVLLVALFPIVCSLEPIPLSPFGGPCEYIRNGDCDPHACQGEGSSCEAWYTRFWDPFQNLDRTRKNCQCVEDSVCSIIGMGPSSGCRRYADLSSLAQKQIREWTYTNWEKKHLRKIVKTPDGTNMTLLEFRKIQLFSGNSRFCCKSKKRRRFAAARVGAEKVYRNGAGPTNAGDQLTLLMVVLSYSFRLLLR
uniref:LNR domain-containing protein n=1 Tax=Panagrellus redivivus TaxID=6233 RepID=A0A7E5A0U0_PANRE